MTKEEIISAMEALNEVLSKKDVSGECCVYGGTVMCLAYDARPATKDVDAVFAPTKEFREAIQEVSLSKGLDDNWLNDAVKGFLVPHPKEIYKEYSHLKLFIPSVEYLIAMKALAARLDTNDKDDLKFLIRKEKINLSETVFDLLMKYYPKAQIKAATRFFIEELFDEIKHEKTNPSGNEA
ncbi:MAG: hypothetical protein SFU91_15265 [Chloroherpetonaceae bacterium]|nr:hypothetical protein [Chloroherpetonaceae bacterium]